MASVNKVILLGNCGRDPEIRYLPSGQAVANISIATTSRRKDKNTGENIESTEWHRVTFFDKLAKIVGEYVKFTTKEGHEQNTCDIVADSMQLLGSRQGSGEPSAPRQQATPAQRPAAAKPASGFEDMDDDIPF